MRNRRKEKRFGPGPANGYTSGYGSRRRRGFFGFGRKRGTGMTDENALPEHTHPADVRDSYATEQTRVGESYGDGTAANTYNKYGEPGYTRSQAATPVPGATENPYYSAPRTAPAAHAAPAVNPYRSDVNSGITGGGYGTSAHGTVPA